MIPLKECNISLCVAPLTKNSHSDFSLLRTVKGLSKEKYAKV